MGDQITILEDEGKSSNSPSGKNVKTKSMILSIIAPVLISLAISLMLVYSMAPSKSGFDKLSKDFDVKSSAAIDTLNTQAADLSTKLSKQMVDAQNALDGKLSSMDAKITPLTTRVSALETQDTNTISSLSRLDKLVTDGTTGVNASLAVINSAITTNANSVDAKISASDSKQNAVITQLSADIVKANDLATKAAADAAKANNALQTNTDWIAFKSKTDTDIASLKTNVTTLQQQVNVLQGYYNVSNISISTVAVTAALTSGVATSMPLTIVNSGAANVTVPVKLIMTASAAISSVSASMDRTFTVTIVGNVVTFYTSIDTIGNSTLSTSPSITITYASTPATINWTATWSKQ